MMLKAVKIVSPVEIVESKITVLMRKLSGVFTNKGAEEESPECHVQPNGLRDQLHPLGRGRCYLLHLACQWGRSRTAVQLH